MNLRDKRNVGAYHENKRNYAYSIELGLAKENNGRFNLTYRFPSIPKQTYSFKSEAGTFEGIRIASNFSLIEMPVPIVTVPSRFKEDFGKRNMPGKRARRHFSQLSEFERGLMIRRKTAGWSTCRAAGQVDRSEKTTGREDRRIVRQALVDPTMTRSTIRADVGVAIAPQTISRHLAEANLKSKRPFRALPLTPEYRQLRLQWCQARSMWNVTD
ncbi:transposable element Tc1 transposase [Trichonephila clavipes]|nr:transposable element Tc1 transposase [Trichonephila clavipes]